VFLVQGESTQRIFNYDPATNEWILGPDEKDAPKNAPKNERGRRKPRATASGSTVTAVAPVVGG